MRGRAPDNLIERLYAVRAGKENFGHGCDFRDEGCRFLSVLWGMEGGVIPFLKESVR
jgi:hypothetical protein